MEIPKVTENYYKEREGVLKVASLLNSYKYIFRETPNGDIGIDGQIEQIGVNGELTGKLVAAQIKSGDSYLADKGDHFAFYPKPKHQNYWSIFPLPVILLVNYPKDDRIYFTDVRYQLNIPQREHTYIRIDKSFYLTANTAKRIFETAGGFDTSYQTMEEIFDSMVRTICKNPTFNISYLDLFTQGLTNLCRHVFFNMDLAVVIAEYNNTSEYDLSLGYSEHEFLHDYAKFIITQNLATIDYADYLIDWNERQLQPSFIAPLTVRGRQLLEFIKTVEIKFKDQLPPTTLIRERSIQMNFRSNEDYLRLEMAKALTRIVISKG